MRKLLTLSGLALALLLVAAVAKAQVDASEITDALERAKARGKLVACADPYTYPYAAEGIPPGFDVEIVAEIARLSGLNLEMFWADTGTRGGTSRAFRNSILKNRCDVFVGLSDGGDDDMLMGELAFTRPHAGMGYVLVVQGRAAGKKTLDEIRAANIKVGVMMSTPIDDYLFTNKISRELFLDNRRLMRSMANDEIDAGLVWGPAIAVARREFPNAKFQMVPGYVPEPGQRFNLNFVVRKQDKSMMEFINKGIETLLANGKIKQIVESYNVPFYPPFS
jgi:ABC-type amino acid transport substrate-binding protein